MLKIVCFGDSITARKEGFTEPMLTNKLAKQIQDAEIINAGVAGNNTCDAITRIHKDVIIHNPDLVTVLFGTNDAALHKMVDLETYKSNLYKITYMLKPDKVILISPSPVDETVQFARTNKILFKYALAMKQVSDDTGCHFIDFFTELISLEDYPKELKGVLNDGLHFGEEGYDFLVNLLTKKIREIGY